MKNIPNNKIWPCHVGEEKSTISACSDSVFKNFKTVLSTRQAKCLVKKLEINNIVTL